MTRLSPVALLAGTALFSLAAGTRAAPPVLPTGGSVAAGSATIATPQAGAMQIVQGSDRAVINWQGFSIGEGGRVDITQPSARAALLNRVTGSATSEIAGQLNANGRVFLVNPNGILITKTGSVNASGFTASTLDISDHDFMAGSDELTVVGHRPGTSVVVGHATGGYAGLMDGRTPDNGYIRARLVSNKGGAGAIDLTGDGFMQVAVPAGGIGVAGKITANEVVLRAGTAREAVRGTVNLSGTIRATGVENRGGTVVLTGADVNLAGATIDASGARGGGSVRIGGDRKGGGTLAHATNLTVDAGSTIKADATGSGDGGNVVLWSDAATRFAGTISAQGADGGAGGDAEVSGKARLAYLGTADLRGTRFGTLLLDPYNVVISNQPDSQTAGFTATGNDSNINAGRLQTALSTANVTVSTGSGGNQRGDITVKAPITWSSGSRLTLDAAGAITIDGVIINVTGGGQVALNYNRNADPVTGGFVTANNSALTFSSNANQASQALTINGQSYRLIHSIDELHNAGGASNLALAFNLYTSGNKSGPLIGKLSGTIEGLGHIIDGYRTFGQNNLGLVGEVTSTGSIRNIGLFDGSVNGASRVGGLAGVNRGQIYNSYSVIPANGNYSVGGLVGENRGLVSNSFTTGAIFGTNYIGGLVGTNYGTIQNSWTKGKVEGTSYIGGLVGLNYGTVRDSYTYGDVSGSNYVGGVYGRNRGTVTGSYASGHVSGSSGGGLFGGWGLF